MELGIFMRDHFNGMYRTDTYYLTRQMAEMPIQILSPIIFTSIFYWMVGMNPDISRFLMACVINILLVQVHFWTMNFWYWYYFILFRLKYITLSWYGISHKYIHLDNLGSSWIWLHGLLSCPIVAGCSSNIRTITHSIDDFWRIFSR